jgi:glycosyltransferase involved in cell wall biosynthesis
MRLLTVSPSFFRGDSIIGGGERYAVELSRALANYLDVEMVTFGARRETFNLDKLKVNVFPSIYNFFGVRTNPLNLEFLYRLPRFDIVHIFQNNTVTANLASIVGKAIGRRIIVSDLLGGHWNLKFYIDLDLLVDCFALISNYVGQKFYPRFKNKTKIIYGGVDTIFFRPMGLPRERKITYVGRIVPVKGIENLIKAVDETTPVNIIGHIYDQAYFEYLQSIVGFKNIRFLTSAGNDELVKEYNTSRLVVLPTTDIDYLGNKTTSGGEIFGLVLVEAMACGTPVIATNIGGAPEVVVQGKTGYLVSPNDPAALKARMDEILADDLLFERFSQEARGHAVRNFTWDSVARRCIEIYEDLG